MRIILLVLLSVSAIVAAHAGQFTARVISVIDGDTVMVMRNGGPPFKVRLADIDAPEKGQPDGIASRKSLSELVLHKQVSLNTQAVDIYGRLVAQLAVDGKSINEEQVRRGMAWERSNYHSNKVYVALQNEAQQARRGLWAGAEIMEPAQWRKLHADEAPATTLHPKPSVPVPRD
ncbi:MAG: thermonuclease family protein [Gallionella sp.]